MALIKERINQQGQKASYWKLAILVPDFVNNTSVITLFGYESEAAKNAGNNYIMADGINVDSSYFSAIFNSGNIRANAYQLIKTLPQWQGAADA